jgi:hypothetical protein
VDLVGHKVTADDGVGVAVVGSSSACSGQRRHRPRLDVDEATLGGGVITAAAASGSAASAGARRSVRCPLSRWARLASSRADVLGRRSVVQLDEGSFSDLGGADRFEELISRFRDVGRRMLFSSVVVQFLQPYLHHAGCFPRSIAVC